MRVQAREVRQYNPYHLKTSSKIRAFMTPLLTRLVCAVCMMMAAAASAQKADTSKPMSVEADTLRYDDLQQTTVFTGRVVLTRGGIVIKGARMEVRQDPQGFQYGLVTAEPGKRAYFRQQRDDADEYIEGEGETLEYDGRADVVKLIKNAELRRLRGARVADVVSGNVIHYYNLTDVFTVDGAAQQGGDRVRATLTPRSEPAPSGAARPGLNLRTDGAPSGARP